VYFLLFSPVFVHTEPRPSVPILSGSAKLEHRLGPQAALPYSVCSSAPLIQPLCFQTLPHSFAQRTTRICFPFNNFRTLSIATEGVGGSPTAFLKNYFKSVRNSLETNELAGTEALLTNLRELPPESSRDAKIPRLASTLGRRVDDAFLLRLCYPQLGCANITFVI
jgi:hypothetical protein